MEKQLLFALDIGTRSVVGLVGEKTENSIRIVAVERKEHHTRAMLDGQIHDVPEVANILNTVKSELEKNCGPLTHVSVAAAGRALCTIKSSAELETHGKGLLTADDERALELAAIQAAQKQLAVSDAVENPTGYYCVGYSVVNFFVDNTAFKTLVGQRGNTTKVEVIATFLPRQVIDSLQAAIQNVGLEMATITLEPIAAISILIPPTMRHLNLALVDVGAGTSDVAITKNGSVVGYGMVPCAGDEITEALSQKYLLDFNVAEKVKRQLNGAKNKKVSFNDILGCAQKISAEEITAAIAPTVAELAQAIASQILDLNSSPPQAVLLVGGGSLTPLLSEALAQALDIPSARVAIRRPDNVDGVLDIPAILASPDGVTPLGILKLSGGKTLNFVNVTLNGQALHLFNLGHLTTADALLAAGINIRSMQGRPGMGITITVNGQTKFLPGSHGTPGSILLNNNVATFNDRLNENDTLTVTKGKDGISPTTKVREVIDIPNPLTVFVNGKEYKIPPAITIDGKPASPDAILYDRSQLICRIPETLGEILTISGIDTKPLKSLYLVNDTERTYTVWPKYTINGQSACLDTIIKSGDRISTEFGPMPTLGEILGLADCGDQSITVFLNGKKITVPTKRYTFTIDGQPARLSDGVPENSIIEYSCYEQSCPMLSEVLLTAEFNPRNLQPGTCVDILLNGQAAEYTAPVKNGDAVDIIIAGVENKITPV